MALVAGSRCQGCTVGVLVLATVRSGDGGRPSGGSRATLAACFPTLGVGIGGIPLKEKCGKDIGLQLPAEVGTVGVHIIASV